MVLYPNKLPESERVCFGICKRTIELAAEGHSFSDMKRWKLLETLNGPVYGIALYNAYYTRVVTERDYLWPFPLSECEKNPDLAKGQNPGW